MNTYLGGIYDVAVLGAGHAGCEAALACARMGLKTLCLTMNLDSVALMACNPAIGGTSKGHLVRELDALGGEMGAAADDTFIQIRMLNTGKGPAVHSLRAQMDKRRYHERMKRALEEQENLDQTVTDQQISVTIPADFFLEKEDLVAEGTLANHSEKDIYEIYLTVDGEPVTETATLAPGAALSGIRLLNVLALGDYDATAHVTAIRDGAILGTLQVETVIHVAEQWNLGGDAA